MTVSATIPKITYVHVGPGDYSFTFKIYKPVDVTVYHTNTVGHVIPKILNLDYEIIQTEGVQGGICRIITAWGTGGYNTIERKLLVTQETDWVNNDPFNAEQLEDDLDRMVMSLQEFNRDLTAAAVYVAWKGNWVTNSSYYVRDMVSGPDLNIYTCMITHVSSYSFSNDVADGKWALMIPVGDMDNILNEAIAARDAAIAAASNAAASAQDAYDSAIAAAAAANDAEASSIVAINAELNAANCSVEAHDSAIDSHLGALESYHWANMSEDVPVPESTTPPEYSSYHWSKKAEGIVGGGITALTGVPPVLVTGSASAKTIDLDKTDRIFVPSGGTHDQALMVHAGVPIWKTPPYPTPPDQIYYGPRNLLDNARFLIDTKGILPFSGLVSLVTLIDRWSVSDLPAGIRTVVNIRPDDLLTGGGSALQIFGSSLLHNINLYQRIENPWIFNNRPFVVSGKVRTSYDMDIHVNIYLRSMGAEDLIYASTPVTVPSSANWYDFQAVIPAFATDAYNLDNESNLRVEFSVHSSPTMEVYYKDMQVAFGDTPGPFMPTHPAVDIQRCLRYYYKTSSTVLPAVAGNSDARRKHFRLNPVMRKVPVVQELSAIACTGTLQPSSTSVYAEYIANSAAHVSTIRFEANAEFDH